MLIHKYNRPFRHTESMMAKQDQKEPEFPTLEPKSSFVLDPSVDNLRITVEWISKITGIISIQMKLCTPQMNFQNLTDKEIFHQPDGKII